MVQDFGFQEVGANRVRAKSRVYTKRRKMFRVQGSGSRVSGVFK